MESSKSPASVATNIMTELPSAADGGTKFQPPGRPPMFRSQSERLPFNRSSSMPEEPNDGDAAENESPNRATDDIDAHKFDRRQTMADFKSSSFHISDSTRHILEQMSSTQLESAKNAFEEVKQRRRDSGLINEGSLLQNIRLGKILEGDIDPSIHRRSSASVSDAEGEEGMAGRSGSPQRRGSSQRSGGSGEGEDRSRSFCQSMGPLGAPLEDFSEGEEDESDNDDYDDLQHKMNQATLLGNTGNKIKGKSVDKSSGGERSFSQSMGAMDALYGEILSDTDEDDSGEDDARAAAFKDEKDLVHQMGRSLAQDDDQLKAVHEIADHTFGRLVRKHSGSHAVGPECGDDRGNSHGDASKLSLGEPKSQRRRRTEDVGPSSPMPRRPGRQRRAGMMPQSSSEGHKSNEASKVPAWKPLSSNPKDGLNLSDDEEDKSKNNAASAAGGRGIGGFWNKLTSSFTSESAGSIAKQVLEDNKPTPKPKKEISGAGYFRRGKKKASRAQFLQAVALYNFALLRQREELGENHIDCATTLNEIGVCWMMLGERYPALTAFEEALFIRQKRLGHGAMEVAETTNNIWMILHEERCEMEQGMEEE